MKPAIDSPEIASRSVVTLPVYSTAEYMLILSPHEALWKKVMQVKSDFAKKFNCPLAFSSRPYLPLLRFMQLEMMEEKICNRFRMIAMAQPCAKIELKDYGSYPSHTIYIQVTSKVPITNLVKSLKEAQPLLKYKPDFKPHFMNEPHLTIASKLVPWQYEKAWLEYSQASFTGRFIANKMTLLKRRIGQNAYQQVTHFDFENLPVVTTQGSLF